MVQPYQQDLVSYYRVPYSFLPRFYGIKLTECQLSITRCVRTDELVKWRVTFGWDTPGMSEDLEIPEATNSALKWAIKRGLFTAKDKYNPSQVHGIDVVLERILEKYLP